MNWNLENTYSVLASNSRFLGPEIFSEFEIREFMKND